MAIKGDKFIIEIGDIYYNTDYGHEDKLYQVHGCPSVFLDDDDIKNLEAYKDDGETTTVSVGSVYRRKEKNARSWHDHVIVTHINGVDRMVEYLFLDTGETGVQEITTFMSLYAYAGDMSEELKRLLRGEKV